MFNDRTESGDKQSEQARIRREHIIQIVIDKAAAEKNTEQKCTQTRQNQVIITD